MKKYLALLFAAVLLLSAAVAAVPAAAATSRVEYCEYCQKEVEWTAWSSSAKGDSKVATGHYYLADSFSIGSQKIAMGTVCLDLNGNTLESVGRALLCSGKQSENPIVNVMDSKGGGVVIGKGGTNNAGGGTAVASYGGIINLYGGTLQYETIDGSITTLGGVVCVYGDASAKGIFNLWGGCVDGSKTQLVKDTKGLVSDIRDGCGAAIAVYSYGMLNLRGGRVIAGKAEPEKGFGDCIYIESANERVVLAKDVQVDDIYFKADPSKSLTISGKFTGKAQLSSRVNQGEGVVIGKATANADISGGNVTYTADSYFVDVTTAGVVLTQNPKPNGTAGAEPTGTRTEYCEYCKSEVTWTAWTSAGQKTLSSVTDGHYYLKEDISGSSQKIIKGTVCLDLNGHTLQGTMRSLLVSGAQATNPILSVMDSKGGGYVISKGGTNNAGGGTVTISASSSSYGTLNLYGGTLKYITGTSSITTLGGVVSISGNNKGKSTFNMYGGRIDGSECSLVVDEKSYIDDTKDGCGAAIACYNYGILNLRGGEVISGKALEGVGRGDCVFISNKTETLTIAKDAKVEEIWFDAVAPKDSLTIVGKFAGSFTINGNTAPVEGDLVAKLTANGDVTDATMAHASEGYYVIPSEEGPVLTQVNPNATAVVIDGEKVISYNDLNDAVANANGKLIRLNEDVSYPISVAADTYLDLNGHSITGKIQIAEGATLYGMDTETSDYTIEDGVYGKLTDVDGKVAGMPQGTGLVANPYLMHTENGEITFHCLGLQLTAMTLRGEQGGVYYKSAFGGDKIVEQYVVAYGVALSVNGAPTADRLAAGCRTRYTDFAAGGMDSDATSTLLKNIFSKERNEQLNLSYANMPIYGRAYMELTDGTIIFGDTAQRSFKEQIEQVNEIWYTLNIPQRDSAYTIYENFPTILDQWDVMNISAYQDTEKDGILKILNISNSHGQDAIWQLPMVISAEMPEQEYVIVEMYQSYALTEHIQAAKADSPVYHYQVNTGGFWQTITTEMPLSEGLLSENWDYIMMNESSRHLGLESKMSQGMVDWFADYIMEHVGHNPKLLYDMTWASPTDERFYTDGTRQQATATFKGTYTKDYGFDHVNHYNQLVALTKKYIIPNEKFHMVMFNATPVQYAGEVLGVPQYEATQTFDLYRDYTHISDYARLIVAYNMYCQLFRPEGITEVKIDTILWQNRAPWNGRNQKLGNIQLTEEHKQVLIESVNHSLKYPLSITAE